MLRAWNDPDLATEWAACGIAFLLVLELLSLNVIRQSRKGTGFDYWLGEPMSDQMLFQEKAQLEVSGIRSAESESIIQSRVAQKLRQVSQSSSLMPTYIAVVEFSRPMAFVERV